MRGSSNFRSEQGITYTAKTKDEKNYHCCGTGSIAIVGIGPGDPAYLTTIAKEKLEKAHVVVGYTTYIKLIDPSLLKGKEVITSGMRAEIERCEKALEMAKSGKNVVLVSSGDPGIYGMAGPMLEVIEKRGVGVNVEVIPGIPAFCAASALVGAPVMHDFVVVSLSDLLTPWELIKKRIILALEGDFVIVIYNPRSRQRNWQLEEIKQLIMKQGKSNLPVAIVKNVSRKGEKVVMTTIKDLDVEIVDMVTILIIGNSTSRITKNWFITPRGYKV